MSNEREAKYAEHLKGWWFEGDQNVETVALSFWNTAWLAATKAAQQSADDEFKNFHCLLCERFDYSHDEKDWKRDQLSLIEWIAGRPSAGATGQEPVAWFTDDHLSDKSATTWDRSVADRWRAKGWTVGALCYAAPTGDNGASQPAESKRVELTRAQREALERAVADTAARGHIWASRSISELLARAQAKGE